MSNLFEALYLKNITCKKGKLNYQRSKAMRGRKAATFTSVAS